MSTLQVVPSQPCDDLLDFIYGGLSPAKQKAFEEHLATCTNNCKAEVEATQKIRNLAKEALPPVEPSNDRMAAIQAQLLHAAAQRKGGAVIPLFRRIVTHPGFSAAAAMIVVGLYVTTQWGNLKMPTKSSSSDSASAPAAAAPAPAPATATTTPIPAANPAPATPVVATKTPAEAPPADPSEQAIGGEGAAAYDKSKRELAKTEQKADNKPSKELFETRKDAPTDDELWRRKAPTASAPKPDPAPEAKPAEVAMKKKSKMDADLTDALGASMPSGAKGGSVARGDGGGNLSTGTLSGGLANSSGPGNGGKVQLAQPSAPPPAKPSAPASQGYYDAKVVEERDSRADKSAHTGNTKQAARPPATQLAEPTPAPTPAPQAEAPVVVAAPPPAQAQNYAAAPRATSSSTPNNEQQLRGKNEQSNFSNLGKQSSTAESLRRRGDSLARSGKCEDALRAFNDANRVAPNADNNAADQLSYAKCLRELGRYDAAQMALDSLQRQNVQSNAVAVENEVNLLNNQRRQYGAPTPAAAPSKASKAAPKARSAPASEKASDSAF